MIYNKRNTVTKSAQNHKFKYDHYFYEEQTLLVFSSHNEDDKYDWHKIVLEGKLPESSFTIEGLPEDSKHECGEPGLPNARTTWCVGRIKLQPN